MGTWFSTASLKAPFLKLFMRGAVTGMVPSGKIAMGIPLRMASEAFLNALAASVWLPRFTAMFMPLKKMLKSGHFNSSYLPMKRKYSGTTLYIWMMSR